MSTAAPVPAKQSSAVVKIVLGIILVLAVLVGAVAGYVATKPDDYRITRSATFDAPPETVFEQINDFRNWEHWSPWAKLDPNAKNTFEGPDTGEGAVFRWNGNDEVGEGALTITEVKPHEKIQMRIEFTRPMQDESIIEFTFEPKGEQTVVNWSMIGRYPNFFGKMFCTLMNMDKMIGDDFEKGLASMKSVVEKKS
jgi:uncharacterized protein YndB with AHSA1/START domain